MKKKLFTMLLVLGLLIGMLPTAVYAGLISSVTINVTAPTAGTTSATAPTVSVPAGEGYTLVSSSWVNADGSALSGEVTFAAGETYYIGVELNADEGNGWNQIGPGDGEVYEQYGSMVTTVNGGDLCGALSTMNTSGGVCPAYATIAVTCVPGSAQTQDIYVDETVDTSAAYVIGQVILTDKAKGESYPINVVFERIPVTYSQPKTAEVEETIARAEEETRQYAADQGFTVTEDCVTEETTTKVWDNRKYETVESGDAILIGDVDYMGGAVSGSATRTHIASGDYGKETTYTVTLKAEINAETPVTPTEAPVTPDPAITPTVSPAPTTAPTATPVPTKAASTVSPLTGSDGSSAVPAVLLILSFAGVIFMAAGMKRYSK